MNRRKTMLLNGLSVLIGGIAFVLLKTIFRKHPIIDTQNTITRHLGHDRGTTDRHTQSITVNNRLITIRQIGFKSIAVDQ